MKLTTQRMLDWQTSCLCVFVVILGLVMAAPIVMAQASKPSDKAKLAEAPTDSAKPTPANPSTDSKMPDITGTWGPFARSDVEIRRVENGSADFEMTTRILPQFTKSYSNSEDKPPRRIKWFPKAQYFQTLDPPNQGIASLTMKPNSDGKSMHVTVTINGKPVDLWFGKSSGEMEWQRTDSYESPKSGTADAAMQLIEQLAAQESEAAEQAWTIRKLQSSSLAGQFKQEIAGHQRHLKNLLSTAFDLKLQLEELQVRELQSRLSRLERQIGQRKELREKIINRRAGELIEGEVLRWDSTSPGSTKLPGAAVGNTKQTAKAATPEVVAILRERLAVLWDDLRNGNAKPSEGLRAINELAQAEPPEAHAQHLQQLQALLDLVRGNNALSKAEVLEIEAAYEAARSSDGKRFQTKPGVVLSSSTTAPPPKADQIVIDLYGGSKVLPGLSMKTNPGYFKLLQDLNALKGVTVNFREAGKGAVIVMAIVRDPSQRCQQEARQTQKESELRIAINSALKAAGIEATQSDENSDVLLEKKPTKEPVTSKTDQPVPDFAAGISLDELLSVLQTDRDPLHLAAAIREVGKLDLGKNAERAVSAILGAMEFYEPYTVLPKSNVPLSYFATETLKPIARSAKVPALEKALRNGHPRVKLVAIWSLNADSSLWEYANEPDFPVLAELLMALAAGRDELPRAASLGFLAKTLPITKIDLADLVTDDRREAVRRLTTAIPRDRVLQLITDAVSDEHIEVVLTAARLLLDMPEKLQDSELVTRLVDVLAKVTEGKFHGAAASRSQRGQAIFGLAKLKQRSAPAVPMLIELLQSDDPEYAIKVEESRATFDDFTRDKVILTLGAIGPPAKDALPILEAELAVLDKQAKEDALLSGSTESRTRGVIGGTHASRLRIAIGMIKGESLDSLFRRPNF